MPVVFPTPEELERSPWRVQQATAKRLAEYRQQLRQVAANFDELVDAQVKERRAKVEQDIAQAHAARVEAAHILESLPPEPASLIAGRRHVALEAIYGRSA